MHSHFFENNKVGQFTVIIEHLEPVLGKWIWLEYKHVSKMAGRDNVLFTNVGNRYDASKLREIGEVRRNSIVDLIDKISRPTITLDPQAHEQLSPSDFVDNKSLIVGGILGDHPPRGRTRQAITSRIKNSQARNLGEYQFSVDGAVYVAMQVASGKRIAEIPIVNRIEIAITRHYSNLLPFAYPFLRGKPLLAPGLRRYLRLEISKDEEILFKTGRPRSVAHDRS
jgi:ribosome biogenesis SPOUT family RNA methylase Rps3